MNSKPIAVGLVFGVGMALALNSWLLGIMFGIIFCNFQYETSLAQIKENKWIKKMNKRKHIESSAIYF